MAIKQLFYTSCKKGLSSGMGFQTYSMSKGITNEERKEIESYCVYIPPDNLPTQPSPEEIVKLFPISFSSFRTESGKYCICRAQYTGKDYSGRYGNYFCHVLISDKPWNFYPIELYGSSVFRSQLNFEEENILEIGYLPELEEIPLDNVINFHTISNFFKESLMDKKRKDFIQLMKSVIGYSKDKKRIIFSDDKDVIPFWIAAVQMSLPKKLAQQFSFTTYCYNPEDLNYILCAIDNKGSKFNFRDNQKLYKYNVFNFIDGYNDEVVCNSSFVKRAEVGYTVSKEVFLPFISFLDQFEYNILDENIDHCISLYNMVKKGIEKSDIENVKKALSFAINYKSIDAYKQIFYQLDSKLEKISTQVDIELAEIITKFLFKAAIEVGNSEHIGKAYEFFFNSIHYLVVDVEEIILEDIIDLYNRIRNIEEVSIRGFVEVSLGTTRIKDIQTYLEGGKVRHAKFYFETIVSDIIAFNNKCGIDNRKVLFSTESKEYKNITILLNLCLKILITSSHDILDTFNYFKNDYEYFPKIILTAYYINNCSYKDSRIEELLMNFIIDEGNKNNQWKRKTYSQINNLTDTSDFLFSIYSFELMKNSDKKDFFINYCNEVFKFFHDYRDKKFSDALKLYLGISDSEDTSLEEYSRIIDFVTKSSIIEIIDKPVLRKLFTNFEEKINIESVPGEVYIIEKIFQLKADNNIKTPCSITELIHTGRRIQSTGIVNRAALLQDLKVEFFNMSADKYEKYLKWFLSNICVYLKDSRDHSKVKKALFCMEYSSIFYKIYMDTLEDIVLTKKYKDILKSYDKEGYEIFMDFIILVFKDIEDLGEETEKIVDERIINILTKVSEKKLKEYEAYLRGKSNNLKDKIEIMIQWGEITRKLKQKGQKKSLLNFFKK
ncbi:hypothetical protein [Clostridium sp. DJ247]|uniref:GAP1-N2 domain-containing protein n=1 Tax=Clostridium sp. DJ247 TaxID=2726188 RepID=UPI001629BEBB|nr:hypothetical protein [Clostridium sp. DJ247]MBC2580433.1 hypothetical protein [Clostridium sp. DJ247]